MEEFNTQHPAEQLFAEGGEMGALMASIDWSKTPLGPVAGWSPALRNMVRLLLRNRFPMLLWWGPRFVQLYNDAYRPIPGQKHPRSMGQPGDECWAEIWHIIGPMVEAPYRGEPATTSEDLDLLMRRRGFLEETHYLAAYSPVPDDSAVPTGIGGVLATVSEITQQVFGDRQLRTLRDLGARALEAQFPEEACVSAGLTFKENDRDIPFALFYLIDEGRERALLVASVGFEGFDKRAAPAEIELDAGKDETQWPIGRVAAQGVPEVLAGLDRLAGALPCGHWAEPPHTALALPLASPDHPGAYGVLICGVNPHRVLDDGYRTFFDLAAAQVVTAIRNALSFIEERKRAEALAEIDRAKTAFFSNVSHEFRTPLTLMLGPAEDLMAQAAGRLAPEDRERVELLHRNGLRLLKLVNSLLDFSRIEAERMQASFEPVDLTAMTCDLVSIFRSAFDKAQLALEVDCETLKEPVYVDRDLWEKIVLNLVSNAFKFTFSGQVTVSLRETEHAAVMEVRDTGTGIPLEELPRLFQRFHRVQGARGRSQEGTGIGLALVYELVKLHGGTIRVASRLDEGTTFTVSVPKGYSHLPADQLHKGRPADHAATGSASFIEEAMRWLPEELVGAAGRQTPPPAQDGRHSGVARQGRILLADDNADMRDYVQRLLENRWQVEAVSDGVEALAAAERNPPDLVVSDVMMPRMDGFELVRRLRKHPATRMLPIILLSARAGEESTWEGLETGADDYLIKPFSARELLARVDTHFRMAQARKQSEEALRKSQERLATSQKMDAMGKMAGGFAHEFNNLLTSINGYASLLVAALGEGRNKEYLQEILKSGERAANLTRQILAFGRKQILAPKILDLSRMLEDMRDMLSRVVGENIALEVRSGPGTPSVKVDPGQMQEVILHLVVNARDAMPMGGRLTLETSAVEVGKSGQTGPAAPIGKYARLAVIDTGIGMDEATRSKIFEPFFTTKAIGKGPGLGLPMVEGVIRQSGGFLDVESTPGQGTTFKIHLPAMDEKPQDVHADPLPAPSHANGNITVLVVEDEESLRRFIANALSLKGYQVMEAASGKMALDMLSKLVPETPDVLLTDVVMPGMSGRELAERLVARRPGLKVIYMSGYTEDAVIRHGVIGEGIAFLGKPFSPGQMHEKIQEVLKSVPIRG